MEALAGPYAATAVLLVVAGAPKVVRPLPTARALTLLRLPGRPLLVRLFGAVETVIGVAALARGGPVVAALVAASYALFAAVVLVALRRGGPLSSCGCFGKADTPPTRLHLALNVLAAAVALTAPPPIASVVDGGGAAAVSLAVLVALCAWFGYLAMVRLPQVGRLPS
jgi:hypothetical protein